MESKQSLVQTHLYHQVNSQSWFLNSSCFIRIYYGLILPSAPNSEIYLQDKNWLFSETKFRWNWTMFMKNHSLKKNWISFRKNHNNRIRHELCSEKTLLNVVTPISAGLSRYWVFKQTYLWNGRIQVGKSGSLDLGPNSHSDMSCWRDFLTKCRYSWPWSHSLLGIVQWQNQNLLQRLSADPCTWQTLKINRFLIHIFYQ